MKRLVILLGMFGLSGCQPGLAPDARQYIEQQALAKVGGMADQSQTDTFTVDEAIIDDIGSVGVCGHVSTNRGPILFLALSKEVGGVMMIGPGPATVSSHFQSTLERVRSDHLKLIRESAAKAKCNLLEVPQ